MPIILDRRVNLINSAPKTVCFSQEMTHYWELLNINNANSHAITNFILLDSHKHRILDLENQHVGELNKVVFIVRHFAKIRKYFEWIIRLTRLVMS